MSKEELKDLYELYKDYLETKGKLDKDKVMELVKNFYELQVTVSSLYEEITGGLLSKPSYSLGTVLSVYKNRQEERELEKQRETYDDISHILKNSLGEIYTDDLDEVLKGYFGAN